MLPPILLVECADDDSLAGAGMDEFALFQIDAYVTCPFLFPSVVEEYQVAFFQLSFLHLFAILFALLLCASLQSLAVHLIIYG